MDDHIPDGSYRVVLPYACYQVWVKDGMISDAAPIAKWAVGVKPGNYFKQWVEGKGGTMEPLC